MNACAALNPDPDDDDDDEDEDGYYWTGSEAPSSKAAAQLARLEAMLPTPAENGVADGEEDDEEEGEGDEDHAMES